MALESVAAILVPCRTGLGQYILGGRRLTILAILQSGQPFRVFTNQAYPNGDYNADGLLYDFPNAPAFGATVPNSRSDFMKGVFTKADFPAPPRGQEGNLGRNGFTGPGLANVN